MTTTAARWAIPGGKVIITAADIEKDRTRWLEARRRGVTATDSRVLMGHGYAGESPYLCWRQKVDTDTPVEEMPFPGVGEDARIHLGTEVEPVIRSFASKHLGVEIRRVGFLQSRQYDWLLSSPDGACSDGAGLEMKMTSEDYLANYNDTTNRYTNSDGRVLPDPWRDQVQHQLLVSGQPFVHVAALVLGDYKRYFTYWRVYPDPRHQDQLLALDAAFWEQVTTQTPPPPNWDDEEEIKSRWPVAEEMAVTVDDDTAAEVRAMIAEREELQALADSADRLTNILRGLAGDAQEVRDRQGNLLFRYGNVRGQVWDQEALDQDGIKLANYKRQVANHHRSLTIPKARAKQK